MCLADGSDPVHVAETSRHGGQDRKSGVEGISKAAPIRLDTRLCLKMKFAGSDAVSIGIDLSEAGNMVPRSRHGTIRLNAAVRARRHFGVFNYSLAWFYFNLE